MNQKELKELIEFLIEKDIAEFELERGDVKVRIKRAGEHGGCVRGGTAPFRRASGADCRAFARHGSGSQRAGRRPRKLRRPRKRGCIRCARRLWGLSMSRPSPGSPPFVKPGDVVEVGQVLCIVEAMKLMNEIESDVAGEIVKKLVANGQPIEYGQELFVIRRK